MLENIALGKYVHAGIDYEILTTLHPGTARLMSKDLVMTSMSASCAIYLQTIRLNEIDGDHWTGLETSVMVQVSLVFDPFEEFHLGHN